MYDVGEELMGRASQERLAHGERRRRVVVLIDREDLGVEERCSRRGALRSSARLEPNRPRPVSAISRPFARAFAMLSDE